MRSKSIIILMTVILTSAIIKAQPANHHHSHHAAIFLGGASGTHVGGTTNFAVGLDYEYSMNTQPEFGIGLIVESVFAEENEIIAGIPIYIHPIYDLKFWLAPSIINAKHNTHETEPGEEHNGEQHSVENYSVADTRFFMRFGSGYDFHLGSYVITPTLEADIISSQLIVTYGISFGIVF